MSRESHPYSARGVVRAGLRKLSGRLIQRSGPQPGTSCRSQSAACAAQPSPPRAGEDEVHAPGLSTG